MDTNRFWSEHDEALSAHVGDDPAQRGGLSHDLYRGMPPWFNAYYAHFQRRALLKLLTACGSVEGTRALDVGCGTGRWSQLLLERRSRPVGMDMGLRAVRLAQTAHPAARFCAAALPDLCFADGIFDLAISVTVLQHVPPGQQPAAVADIARVLKRGGHLIAFEIVDPNDTASHVFPHAREAWLAMFRAAGLRLVAQSGCEFMPYVKWFQQLRGRLARQAAPEAASASADAHGADVTGVSAYLRQRRAVAWILRAAVLLAYPVEYLASWLLPDRAARLGGFLLEKE